MEEGSLYSQIFGGSLANYHTSGEKYHYIASLQGELSLYNTGKLIIRSRDITLPKNGL
jgi:hypothetical protein